MVNNNFKEKKEGAYLLKENKTGLRCRIYQRYLIYYFGVSLLSAAATAGVDNKRPIASSSASYIA